MAIRDTLLFLPSYPEPAPASVVTAATDLAVALGARISALSFELQVSVPGRPTVLVDQMIDIPGMAAVERKKSAANARAQLTAFESAASKHQVCDQALLDQATTSSLCERLVDHARLYDLTIMPVWDHDFLSGWYCEALIFSSGRPVIAVPAAFETRGSSIRTVVVAWDFSRPAARALGDAVPILQKAGHVRLLTLTADKVFSSTRSHADVQRHLAHHGIEAAVDLVQVAGPSAGEALKEYAASHDADLLVMGGFGHSRMREFILGGATRSVISEPMLPVLLSH